jgi:hypothetical protein
MESNLAKPKTRTTRSTEEENKEKAKPIQEVVVNVHAGRTTSEKQARFRSIADNCPNLHITW